MAPERPGVRIAVNVMRARLTIVGFNLAIVTFQLNAVRNFAGGVEVPGLGHVVHLAADVALLMAVALSIAAMVLFIAAGAFDSVGVVDHPAVVVGDLFMYLALAQSVAGFFEPIVATLRETVAALGAANWPGETLIVGVVAFGALGWGLAFYVGPLVSLMRSPFDRATTLWCAGLYVALALALAGLDALATQLERTSPEAATVTSSDVLASLARPTRW